MYLSSGLGIITEAGALGVAVMGEMERKVRNFPLAVACFHANLSGWCLVASETSFHLAREAEESARRAVTLTKTMDDLDGQEVRKELGCDEWSISLPQLISMLFLSMVVVVVPPSFQKQGFLYMLALALQQRRRWADCISLCQEASRLYEKGAILFDTMLPAALVALSKYPEAEEAIIRCLPVIKRAPPDRESVTLVQYYMYLSECLVHRGEVRQAHEVFYKGYDMVKTQLPPDRRLQVC